MLPTAEVHRCEAHTSALTAELIHLSKVSSLLKSRRFASWYEGSSTRWTWAGAALSAKLRDLLMYQVDQALDRAHSASSATERLRAFADQCEQLVKVLGASNRIRLSRRDSAFLVPNREDYDQAVCALLASYPGLRVASSMVRDTFYVRNGLSALQVYALSRETIARGSGNERFDRLVLAPMAEDYLVAGYPHDVLAHDAHDVRSGAEVRQLVLRKAYCSSLLVRQHDRSSALDDQFRVINFKMAA